MLILLLPLAMIVMYLLWRRSGRGATRACRWRLDRSSGQPRFRCAACGAEAQTGSETPPDYCARPRED